MAAAGLISRRRDRVDARLVRLYLTERARSVQSEIERERDELAARATATLTSEELAVLMSALRKMIAEFADDKDEKLSDDAADAAGDQASYEPDKQDDDEDENRSHDLPPPGQSEGGAA
jgi:hypothetical protein